MRTVCAQFVTCDRKHINTITMGERDVDIASTQPDRLIKYRVSDDRFTGEVLLPGLWYTDFDRKIGGKLPLWSIVKLEEACRWQCLRHGLAYHQELHSGTNHTTFVAGSTYDLTPNLHQIHYHSNFGIMFPIYVKIYISFVGKTSYTIMSTFSEYKTKNVLMTVTTKIVYISNITRKPAPLPPYIKKNHSKRFQEMDQNDLKRKPLPKIPGNAHTMSVKSLHSDCDMNNHINQSVYVRWVSDAMSAAAKAGQFSRVKKHVERYPLESMSTHYVREALANEEVTLYSWEDNSDPALINCVVTSGDKLLTVVTVRIGPGEPVHVAAVLESKI